MVYNRKLENIVSGPRSGNDRKGKAKMIRYKIDILEELKKNGYNTGIIKRDGLLPGQTITNLKAGKGNITLDTLNKLCIMLRCQPGDLIECHITDDEKIKYFR